MKIEYEDIQTFKRMNLAEVIQSYGHTVKKQGEGYITNCPFHEDKTPSLSINQKKEVWLWHCFGCGKGGTVIDFVMMKEGLSVRDTYEKLSGIAGIREKKDKPLPHNELLGKVADHYHKAFLESAEAREYLKSRGLDSEEIYSSFKIGYAGGTIKKLLPWKGAVISKLKEIGILNEKGNETFYGCVVVPLLDEDGNVVSLYGRNIKRGGHLYLKGPHRGLVNRQGAYGGDKLILTESIIDALSLYRTGVRNVVPCYGTSGLTREHKELIKSRGIKEIEIAFDNDEAGRIGAERLKGELKEVSLTEVSLPDGIKDINDLIVSGKGKSDYEDLPREVLRKDSREVAYEEGILHLKRGDVNYRVRVGEREYISRMRVNVKLTYKGKFQVDVIDLYSQRSRGSYIKRMNGLFDLDKGEVEEDLSRIMEEVEQAKDTEKEDLEEKNRTLTEEERKEAIRALKSPSLIEDIKKDLAGIGCVGEERNKLLGYLVTISRKLDTPLSMIIVSQSGAGKSNLADTLEEVVPEEDCVHLSRITPQALYYMGKSALRKKVLIIEEKEGSQAADYSLRVLQSKKVLRLAVPIKDPNTGKMKTEVSEVEGQVTVIETTTKTELNPENTSRCFIVYLDESEEQTKRIHEYQRRSKTIEGAVRKTRAEGIIRKHQNMQRVLEEVVISNPLVDHIEFPTKWLRVRRDHMKFLNLIEAITFLNQYRRERKLSADGAEYIETTIEDYSVAYDLAKDVVGDCLTELMKPERDFYGKLEKMTEETEREKFSRRDIREYTGLPDHHVRKVLKILVEMEYVLVAEGKNGVRYEYKLNREPKEAVDIVKGLTTPDELKKKLGGEGTLRAPCENLASRLKVCV